MNAIQLLNRESFCRKDLFFISLLNSFPSRAMKRYPGILFTLSVYIFCFIQISGIKSMNFLVWEIKYFCITVTLHSEWVLSCFSHVWLFSSPWTVTYQAPLWNFPGKNTGVGCHFLLQGIFPTQGQNPRLMHWQADSLPLDHQLITNGAVNTGIFPPII